LGGESEGIGAVPGGVHRAADHDLADRCDRLARDQPHVIAIAEFSINRIDARGDIHAGDAADDRHAADLCVAIDQGLNIRRGGAGIAGENIEERRALANLHVLDRHVARLGDLGRALGHDHRVVGRGAGDLAQDRDAVEVRLTDNAAAVRAGTGGDVALDQHLLDANAENAAAI
jgi:hypothetical protein